MNKLVDSPNIVIELYKYVINVDLAELAFAKQVLCYFLFIKVFEFDEFEVRVCFGCLLGNGFGYDDDVVG